jgi:SPP1 gp7 family putative phage head morphogenesis protein
MPTFEASIRDAKAMVLQLDPDDDEAESKARRKLEKDATDDIAKGLEQQGKRVRTRLSDNVTASDIAAIEDEIRDAKLLDAAVTRTVTNGAELGVSVAQQQLGRLAVDVAWNLVNDRAVRQAREYAGTLITQIDDHTLDATRQAIASWAESGAPLPDLIEQLTPLFGEERAGRIATTEVTRSFADANRAAYEESGIVQQMEWRTAVDEKVCPICGPLHEERRDLDESFGEDVFGEEMLNPPAHPNCRCWIAPVVEGR